MTEQTLSILWNDGDDSKNSVVLTKVSGEKIVLSIGDFITYNGRKDGVRITGFSGTDREIIGPIGMYYTPWRKEAQKWATQKWCLKGDMRHIIALPCGSPHWGEIIDWNSVNHLNDGVCPVEVV
jgi:hypothetical protein